MRGNTPDHVGGCWPYTIRGCWLYNFPSNKETDKVIEGGTEKAERKEDSNEKDPYLYLKNFRVLMWKDNIASGYEGAAYRVPWFTHTSQTLTQSTQTSTIIDTVRCTEYLAPELSVSSRLSSTPMTDSQCSPTASYFCAVTAIHTRSHASHAAYYICLFLVNAL